jgi:dihydroorotate dehydrogenase electron transfer subunit
VRRDERVELLDRQSLSPDAHLLHFRSKSLSGSFRPGQFTMVRLPEASDVLLRRPYSFCDADGHGRFSLLVKEAGPGTRALARLPLGAFVSCLGPLGSAFAPPPTRHTPVIVAGGVGIAPFVAFCRQLHRDTRRGIVLLGGRRQHDLYLREVFEGLGMDVRCATEDGSFGRMGLVTDLLLEALEQARSPMLYSCGPSPMLRKVAEMAHPLEVPHQVSLERRMGCGMGCCLGCVVYVQGPDEASDYVRCCTEGPVFDADSVCWEHDPYPL